MKKFVIPLISFLIVFIATYLILCYLPSLRIKLFAEPMEYFIESINHMVLFKTLISVLAGLLVGVITFVFQKRVE